MDSVITSLLLSLAALLGAITFHEFSHAWVANFLGDPTAKRAGRITLNPIAHLDPIGTLMILLVRFGWGKPVPINPNNFRNPRLGSALSALAGPTSNFLLVLFSTAALRLPSLNPYVIKFFAYFILINLALMIFNLLPIPPLDGSKFFALIFPALENPKLEIYGLPILLLVIFFGRGILSNILFFFLELLNVPLNIFL